MGVCISKGFYTVGERTRLCFVAIAPTLFCGVQVSEIELRNKGFRFVPLLYFRSAADPQSLDFRVRSLYLQCIKKSMW